MEDRVYSPGPRPKYAPPRVTCIGGGTGLAAMLRGLKYSTPNITAIVTVADDGGGSGVLRDELGMPPPGDIRNCIQALSNAEPTIDKLMSYRFESGHLAGQSFGNLFLAAMNGISESFDKAVVRMGEVLGITGRVLPVTIADVRLEAEFEDGCHVCGESKIAREKREHDCRIKQVTLDPPHVPALRESLDAIAGSDMIVFGPGSLYTSIIPNLLVDGIPEAVMASKAVKLYICNVMTQPGETEGYTVSDHIRELFSHGGGKLFDICLVNDAPAPAWLLERYRTDGAEQVAIDGEAVRALGVELVKTRLSAEGIDLMRHDSRRLAEAVMGIFREKAPTRAFE